MRTVLRQALAAAGIAFVVSLPIAGLLPARAADHGDAPLTIPDFPRQDANLTDLYAFTSAENLVVVVSTNPAIPVGATEYRFPTDVTFEIHIDVDSRVSPDDPDGLNGGTILDPDQIKEDIIYRIRFDDDNSVRVQQIRRRNGPVAKGVAPGIRGDDSAPTAVGVDEDDALAPAAGPISVFTGLRDDPFIRAPRVGRNSAAIVIEVPLASVIRDQSTILVWATSKVDELDGPIQDHAGRALRSMFGENKDMNVLRPRDHLRRMGVLPDVIIFDTAKPAFFPNGRALVDDVVDMVADPRVLGNDIPPVDANDVAFLPTFPYLAPPQ